MESKLIAGIDVSKDTLDVVYLGKKGLVHKVFKNTPEGHLRILKTIGNNVHYVMESSGPYYLGLAIRLSMQGVRVSVENGLKVKRYIQMKGERNKSDKKDAYHIYHYGLEQELKQWKRPSDNQLKCRQLLTTMELYSKQRVMLKNLLHSIEHQPIQDKDQLRSLKRMLKNLENETSKLEKSLDAKIASWAPDQYKNLQTIPGIGKKISAVLIVKTDAFEKVDNYRQLISLAGMAPKEYQSGSSVHKRVRICKMGGKKIRNSMYLASMTAIRYNQPCIAMFTRMKEKGKNGKVAMIAVANKLLKQSFAIAKSGVPFSQNYQNEIIKI